MEPSFNNINSVEQITPANVTISDEVRDYSNDPTFIKRAQEAKEFLEKVGFPEELLKIREEMYGKDLDVSDSDLKNYRLSAAAIRQAEEAKKFLEEHPIPKELLNIH
jgi:hypothetical protein